MTTTGRRPDGTPSGKAGTSGRCAPIVAGWVLTGFARDLLVTISTAPRPCTPRRAPEFPPPCRRRRRSASRWLAGSSLTLQGTATRSSTSTRWRSRTSDSADVGHLPPSATWRDTPAPSAQVVRRMVHGRCRRANQRPDCQVVLPVPLPGGAKSIPFTVMACAYADLRRQVPKRTACRAHVRRQANGCRTGADPSGWPAMFRSPPLTPKGAAHRPEGPRLAKRSYRPAEDQRRRWPSFLHRANVGRHMRQFGLLFARSR